jgi:hypothetical protein
MKLNCCLQVVIAVILLFAVTHFGVNALTTSPSTDQKDLVSQIGPPRMIALLSSEQVFAYGWPTGSELQLFINDMPIQTRTVEIASWDQNDIGAFFELEGRYNLKAGDILKITGSGLEWSYTVRNLTVEMVDPVADIVSGTADPGTQVVTYSQDFNEQVQQVTARRDGTWSASFAKAGIDLVEGMTVRTDIYDEFMDSTTIDWPVSISPVVEIQPVRWDDTQTVYTDQEIIFKFGWLACQENDVRNFLGAAKLTLILDGTPLFLSIEEVNRYWTPIEEIPASSGAKFCVGGAQATLWRTQWAYPYGSLPPGDHTVYFAQQLDYPVEDGFDPDTDGKSAVYEGLVNEREFTIHVKDRS